MDFRSTKARRLARAFGVLLGPGALLLFHDGSEKLDEAKWRPEPMVAALPLIIDALQERGYELVAADELEFDNSCKVPLI